LAGKPKYWDSWKGQLLRAIIFDKVDIWKDVREKSGLTHNQMLKVVKELRKSETIDYGEIEGVKRFRIIDQELGKAYQSETKEQVVKSERKQSVEHKEWIQKWMDTSGMNTSLDHLHFFLEGPNLTDITRRLMDRAKSNILVVNPFVDGATLGTALRDAAKRKVDVSLITRRPQEHPDRWKFHKTLVSEGVDMYYSGRKRGAGGVHSKPVIVDNEVAIVSSMNFIQSSENDTWETGIVSVDRNVVDSAANSFSNYSDENETVSASEIHKKK
jgi:phosphatidylserine/phosphatidylglycerophosphate/cardiolipin synthase-like enzyme